MAQKDDTITIEKCPLCTNSHTYKLEIERSVIMYDQALAMDHEPRKRSFTRLFSCPLKNEDFQARFIVVEYVGRPIESIDVSGLADETKNH
jgi:hypothetical protein